MKPFKKCKFYFAEGDLTKQWFVFFYVINPETDKYVRKREYAPMQLNGIERKKHLKDLASVIDDLLEKGIITHKSKFSQLTAKKNVREALNEAIEFKKSYVSHRTYNSYHFIKQQFLNWCELNNADLVDINKISTQIAAKFLADYKAKKKIKAKTYNIYLGDLKSIFDRILEVEQITVNPFAKLKRLPVTEANIRHWTTEEASQLGAYLQQNNYGQYIASLHIYNCFLRPNEIISLQLKHYDTENYLVMVDSGSAKNRKLKPVTISHAIKNYIEKLKEIYPEDYYVLSRNYEPAPTPIHRNTFTNGFREVFKKLDLHQDLKIYNLKHKGNFDMHIKQGLTVEEIRQQNRHFDLSITSKYLSRIVKQANPKFKDAPEL